MANKAAILDKIARNLGQLGISSSRGQSSVSAAGLTISYVDAVIGAPMGGIDGGVSPYLGIGIAAPGQLKIKGGAGENSIAAIMMSAARLQIMKVCGDIGNDMILEAGDSAAELALIHSNANLQGMGQ